MSMIDSEALIFNCPTHGTHNPIRSWGCPDCVAEARRLLRDIGDALGTAETGAALVEVARNAHHAEQKLANAAKLAEIQAEDESLWFQARYVSEMYLQEKLRAMHFVVEDHTP